MKNYISLKKAYFLIFYVSKFNFKKSRIWEKYSFKLKRLKKQFNFAKCSWVYRSSPKQNMLKEMIISQFWGRLFDSNNIPKLSLRSKEHHTIFGKKFKHYKNFRKTSPTRLEQKTKAQTLIQITDLSKNTQKFQKVQN